MNIKKINKVLIYTLLVFSLFTFSVYPKSHAKYFDEDEALFYALELDKLFIGENDTISYVSGTNYSKAKYLFTFNSSNLLKDGESVSYRIVVDNVCSIDSVSHKGTKNGNEATVKLTANTDDEIMVNYSCNVEDIIEVDSGIEFVKSGFKIYETYQPDNIEYLYTKGSEKIALSVYHDKDHYPLPTGIISVDKKTLTLPKDAINKYDTFVSWINDYGNKYGAAYTSDLLAYVQSVYSDETAILNKELSLRGIVVTSDANGDYTYEFKDSVIGYARTYYSYNRYNKYYMYFTDLAMTDDQATELLVYYFNTYIYPSDSETATKVLNYINSRGGINKLIKGTTKIPGITFNTVEKVVIISDNILNIIKASESSPVFANHGANELDMINSIIAGLTSNYSFITDAVISYITSSPDCYEFGAYWSKINEAFDKYFVITPVTQDGEGNNVTHNPILFHIYSPYVESDATTHVNYVTATELISGMEVKVEYSISDKEGLKTTLTSINTATGKTLTFEDAMFTTSGTYNDGYYTSVVTASTITISFIIE